MIRKKIFLSVFLFSSTLSLVAQNIGINSTGASPDPSAVLDVSGSDKGILLPRVALTSTNVSAPIISPALSLMVYNTASNGTGVTAVSPGFYFWNGIVWERVISGNSISATDDQNLTGATLTGTNLQINIENGTSANVDLSGIQDGTGTDNQNLSLNGNNLSISGGNSVTLVDNVNDADFVIGNEYNTGATLSGSTLSITDGGGSQTVNLSSLQDQDWHEVGGTQGANNINDDLYTQGSIGVGNTGAHSSASLDLGATDQGFLMNRSDTASIITPAFGLLTLSPSDSCMYMYNGVNWSGMGGVGENCSCSCSNIADGSGGGASPGSFQYKQACIGIDAAAGDEYGRDIIQTSDGGIAIVGFTNSFGAGNFDFYVVKIAADATIEWTRTIGGLNNDYGRSINQTSDGGYIIGGHTQSFGASIYNEDIFVIKLTSTGNLQWSRRVGGPFNEGCEDVVQTSDGGYVGVGRYGVTSSNADMYIFKLNSSGNMVWRSCIGGAGYDAGGSIIETQDGSIVALGSTSSYGAGSSDIYMVKLNAFGSLLWTRVLGGSGSDNGNDLYEATDGNYIIAGQTNSFGAGNYDYYAAKVSASGGLLWSSVIGGTSYEYAYGITELSNSKIVLTGFTDSFGAGSLDLYMVQLSASGVLEWSKTSGGTGVDQGLQVASTDDGGFAILGHSQEYSATNDFVITKIDSNGDGCCTNAATSSTATGGSITSGGTVFTAGNVLSSNNGTVSSGGTIVTHCSIP